MKNESHKLKIAVYGAGAVGSLLGAFLEKAGYDVTLIARGDHCRKIREDGLVVSGEEGTITVSVKAAEKLDFKPDLVFMCMKTQDLRNACTDSADLLKDSLVVTMQNGVHSDQIVSEVLGHKRIIGAIVMYNAMYLEAGKVEYGGEGPVILGQSFAGNGKDLDIVLEILESGFTVYVTENLDGARYMKLLINILSNSLAALSGLTPSGFTKLKVFVRIGAVLIRESLRVLKAAGIEAAAVPGLPDKTFKKLARLPVFLSSALIARTLGGGKFASTKPSTLQSLLRGKTSEADALNGEIVRLAEKRNLDAPFNREVVRQCRRIEQDGRFLTPPEAKKTFFGKR